MKIQNAIEAVAIHPIIERLDKDSLFWRNLFNAQQNFLIINLTYQEFFTVQFLNEMGFREKNITFW
jgi:hypothetical protein